MVPICNADRYFYVLTRVRTGWRRLSAVRVCCGRAAALVGPAVTDAGRAPGSCRQRGVRARPSGVCDARVGRGSLSCVCGVVRDRRITS